MCALRHPSRLRAEVSDAEASAGPSPAVLNASFLSAFSVKATAENRSLSGFPYGPHPLPSTSFAHALHRLMVNYGLPNPFPPGLFSPRLWPYRVQLMVGFYVTLLLFLMLCLGCAWFALYCRTPLPLRGTVYVPLPSSVASSTSKSSKRYRRPPAHHRDDRLSTTNPAMKPQKETPAARQRQRKAERKAMIPVVLHDPRAVRTTPFQSNGGDDSLRRRSSPSEEGDHSHSVRPLSCSYSGCDSYSFYETGTLGEARGGRSPPHSSLTPSQSHAPLPGFSATTSEADRGCGGEESPDGSLASGPVASGAPSASPARPRHPPTERRGLEVRGVRSKPEPQGLRHRSSSGGCWAPDGHGGLAFLRGGRVEEEIVAEEVIPALSSNPPSVCDPDETLHTEVEEAAAQRIAAGHRHRRHRRHDFHTEADGPALKPAKERATARRRRRAERCFQRERRRQKAALLAQRREEEWRDAILRVSHPVWRVGVVLGSGGHTSEMLRTIRDTTLRATNQQRTPSENHRGRPSSDPTMRSFSFPQWRYIRPTYFYCSSDPHSKNMALQMERQLSERAHPPCLPIPRAREVGQSYTSSVFTTFFAFFYCLGLITGFGRVHADDEEVRLAEEEASDEEEGAESRRAAPRTVGEDFTRAQKRKIKNGSFFHLFTRPSTTSTVAAAALPVLPDILLLNGPGVCLPVVMACMFWAVCCSVLNLYLFVPRWIGERICGIERDHVWHRCDTTNCYKEAHAARSWCLAALTRIAKEYRLGRHWRQRGAWRDVAFPWRRQNAKGAPQPAERRGGGVTRLVRMLVRGGLWPWKTALRLLLRSCAALLFSPVFRYHRPVIIYMESLTCVSRPSLTFQILLWLRWCDIATVHWRALEEKIRGYHVSPKEEAELLRWHQRWCAAPAKTHHSTHLVPPPHAADVLPPVPLLPTVRAMAERRRRTKTRWMRFVWWFTGAYLRVLRIVEESRWKSVPQLPPSSLTATAAGGRTSPLSGRCSTATHRSATSHGPPAPTTTTTTPSSASSWSSRSRSLSSVYFPLEQDRHRSRWKWRKLGGSRGQPETLIMANVKKPKPVVRPRSDLPYSASRVGAGAVLSGGLTTAAAAAGVEAASSFTAAFHSGFESSSEDDTAAREDIATATTKTTATRAALHRGPGTAVGRRGSVKDSARTSSSSEEGTTTTTTYTATSTSSDSYTTTTTSSSTEPRSFAEDFLRSNTPRIGSAGDLSHHSDALASTFSSSPRRIGERGAPLSENAWSKADPVAMAAWRSPFSSSSAVVPILPTNTAASPPVKAPPRSHRSPGASGSSRHGGVGGPPCHPPTSSAPTNDTTAIEDPSIPREPSPEPTPPSAPAPSSSPSPSAALLVSPTHAKAEEAVWTTRDHGWVDGVTPVAQDLSGDGEEVSEFTSAHALSATTSLLGARHHRPRPPRGLLPSPTARDVSFHCSHRRRRFPRPLCGPPTTSTSGTKGGGADYSFALVAPHDIFPLLVNIGSFETSDLRRRRRRGRRPQPVGGAHRGVERLDDEEAYTYWNDEPSTSEEETGEEEEEDEYLNRFTSSYTLLGHAWGGLAGSRYRYAAARPHSLPPAAPNTTGDDESYGLSDHDRAALPCSPLCLETTDVVHDGAMEKKARRTASGSSFGKGTGAPRVKEEPWRWRTRWGADSSASFSTSLSSLHSTSRSSSRATSDSSSGMSTRSRSSGKVPRTTSPTPLSLREESDGRGLLMEQPAQPETRAARYRSEVKEPEKNAMPLSATTTAAGSVSTTTIETKKPCRTIPPPCDTEAVKPTEGKENHAAAAVEMSSGPSVLRYALVTVGSTTFPGLVREVLTLEACDLLHRKGGVSLLLVQYGSCQREEVRERLQRGLLGGEADALTLDEAIRRTHCRCADATAEAEASRERCWDVLRAYAAQTARHSAEGVRREEWSASASSLLIYHQRPSTASHRVHSSTDHHRMAPLSSSSSSFHATTTTTEEPMAPPPEQPSLRNSGGCTDRKRELSSSATLVDPPRRWSRFTFRRRRSDSEGERVSRRRSSRGAEVPPSRCSRSEQDPTEEAGWGGSLRTDPSSSYVEPHPAVCHTRAPTETEEQQRKRRLPSIATSHSAGGGPGEESLSGHSLYSSHSTPHSAIQHTRQHTGSSTQPLRTPSSQLRSRGPEDELLDDHARGTGTSFTLSAHVSAAAAAAASAASAFIGSAGFSLTATSSSTPTSSRHTGTASGVDRMDSWGSRTTPSLHEPPPPEQRQRHSPPCEGEGGGAREYSTTTRQPSHRPSTKKKQHQRKRHRKNVQTTKTSDESGGLLIVAFPYIPQLDVLIRDATLVVSHAGAGTILECLEAYASSVVTGPALSSSSSFFTGDVGVTPSPSRPSALPSPPTNHKRGPQHALVRGFPAMATPHHEEGPHPLTLVVPNRSLMHNHQFELAEKLEDHGYLFCCELEQLAPRLRHVFWRAAKLRSRWQHQREQHHRLHLLHAASTGGGGGGLPTSDGGSGGCRVSPVEDETLAALQPLPPPPLLVRPFTGVDVTALRSALSIPLSGKLTLGI